MTYENRKKTYEHFKSIGRHDPVLEKEFGPIDAPRKPAKKETKR